MDKINEIVRKIERGDIETGLNELKKIEKSATLDEKYAIAELYAKLGHIEKAKHLVDELLQYAPDDGNLRIFQAELLIDLEREDEAIEMLMAIEEDDESFVRAQLILADLYQMQSLDEVAEQKLLLAEKKAPDEPIISYGLGLFYLERGDYMKSIPYLKKAIHAKESIDDDRIELYLAKAYSATGHFEEAIEYYRKGLKRHEDIDSLFGYGFTAYQLGEMAVAIKQLEKLKKLDPNYASLYPILARAYEAEEMLDEAMNVLKEGMAVDEYNELLYVLAGKLSFKRQRPEEAVDYLREAIDLNPGNVEAVHTLASFLKFQERYDELEELIERLKEYGEVDPLLTWYEASVLKEKEMYDEAYALFREVEQQFSTDIDFLEEYAFFLLEYGLREQALEKLKALLKLKPDRDDIEQLLFDLEEEAGI